MANLEGACYVPGHIAPGLRSSRLLLESEPLLRSVLLSHMKTTLLLICASASPGESDSCRLIYICWIPLQGQSTAGARRSCIWSHLGKSQTHLHIAPH